MQAAIVTGANGFIGSHLTARLLEHGTHVLALGRSRPMRPWQDRVAAALRSAAVAPNVTGHLVCQEFNLLQPEPAPDCLCFRNLSPAEIFLFQVAGDTNFSPPDPDRQRSINVHAPVRLVHVFQGRIGRVIHVSTAFVAGDRTGLIRESELDCGQGFHNPYERSKRDAEVALTAACRELGLPLVVTRPSIIINDRSTGCASTFTHLNALIEVVTRIQEHFGIHDGSVVSKTVRLMADPLARPNLAPVDSIIPPLLRIAVAPDAQGHTFHLCHPRPPSVAELVALISRSLGILGRIEFQYLPAVPHPLSYTEEIILRAMKPYAPYFNARCEFDLGQTRRFVPDYDACFTPLDVDYMDKVIRFQRGKGKHRRHLSAAG